jgi:hypothetical protein
MAEVSAIAARFEMICGPLPGDGAGDLLCEGRVSGVSNRTIWTLWYQGFEDAPPLVRAALESWRRLNPGWRIVALDRHSLKQWIDLDEVIDPTRSDLPVQKISAVARLGLLQRHGGVWTDPTVVCLRPLDQWLTNPAGFAAFRNPGRDRLMSNWFIAAEKHNALLNELYRTFVGFMNRPFANQNTRFGRVAVAGLERLLGTRAAHTTLWLDPRLQDLIGAYPYLIFHYTFNKVVLGDPQLRQIWDRAPPLEAVMAHGLQALSGEDNGLAPALEAIDRGDWPLQKLDWRADIDSPYWSAVLQRMSDRTGRHDPVLQDAAE